MSKHFALWFVVVIVLAVFFLESFPPMALLILVGGAALGACVEAWYLRDKHKKKRS